jgi:ribosomal protein S18 acetylase RimI-like enzyme
MTNQKNKQNLKISIQGPFLEKASLCEPVLRSLPEWFGLEDANQHYLESIDKMPTFLAFDEDQVVGFLTVLQHYPTAAEVYVTGVSRAYHRSGVGRAMLKSAENYLRGLGVQYLQVKTLSDSHPDKGYAKTRTFYCAVGFHPLEEFKTLWGEENPCLLFVKQL